MKIFIAFIILFATNHLSAQTNEKSITAELIVDKHIASIGGVAAFDSIQSLTREGTQNYFGTVEALIVTFERDKLFRYDAAYSGQNGYWMISKTEGGEYFPWESVPASKFSKAYVTMQQGNLHPHDPLLHYKADSSELIFMSKDTINRKVCSKIKLVSKKLGMIIRLYWIEDETNMLLRMEKYYSLRNKSNDRMKAVDRVDFSDYRKVGDIKLPFVEKFKTFINKVVVGEKESLFTKIEINQTVNPLLYHLNPGTEITSSE